MTSYLCGAQARSSHKNFDRAVFIQQIPSIIVYKHVVLSRALQDEYFWLKMMDIILI